VRVSMLTGAFPPDRCGVGDYVHRLCSQIARMGAEVHVITSAHAAPQPATWEGAIRLYRSVRSWNTINLHRIARLLRDIRPDVVHVQFPSVGYRRVAGLAMLPMLLRARGYRVVLTLHEYLPSPRLSRSRQAVMAAASHSVITTTPEDAAALQKLLPWKRSNVHCINIASNIERRPAESFDRNARRESLGAGPDSPIVCFFGNLHPGKGIEELVEAFAIARRNCNVGTLLIIGSFDPRHTLFSYIVHRRILDLGLSGPVHVTGFVTPTEVSELLLASDICVLPFRDGLSVRRGTFLAAVHHGLPVISTEPSGPMPPDIVHGHNVILVPPRDVGKLAASIEMLVRSPELRSRLSSNLAKLDEQFSWPQIARRTLQVYGAGDTGT